MSKQPVGAPSAGGRARAEKMTREERSLSAQRAARARWDRKKATSPFEVVPKNPLWGDAAEYLMRTGRAGPAPTPSRLVRVGNLMFAADRFIAAELDHRTGGTLLLLHGIDRDIWFSGDVRDLIEEQITGARRPSAPPVEPLTPAADEASAPGPEEP